jgi:hypothetical protein
VTTSFLKCPSGINYFSLSVLAQIQKYEPQV